MANKKDQVFDIDPEEASELEDKNLSKLFDEAIKCVDKNVDQPEAVGKKDLPDSIPMGHLKKTSSIAVQEDTAGEETEVRITSILISTDKNGDAFFMPFFDLPEHPNAPEFGEYYKLPNVDMDEKERNTSIRKLVRFGEAFEVDMFGGEITKEELSGQVATAILGVGTNKNGEPCNTIKQLVSVVKRVANDSGIPIGQIIFDINGEYANPNQQDQGAIAMVYPDETIRYRMLHAEGFVELQTNFYLPIPDGFNIIREVLQSSGGASTRAQDVLTFLNSTFDEPDQQNEPGEYSRWRAKSAAYQSLIYRAGFSLP